jgi:hypothetical protein
MRQQVHVVARAHRAQHFRCDRAFRRVGGPPCATPASAFSNSAAGRDSRALFPGFLLQSLVTVAQGARCLGWDL